VRDISRQFPNIHNQPGTGRALVYRKNLPYFLDDTRKHNFNRNPGNAL